MRAHSSKNVLIGIVVVLVGGLVLLGLQVKTLRAEVVQLSQPSTTTTTAPQVPAAQRFSRPSVWPDPFNTPWDPYAELDRIQQQMSRLVHNAFGQTGGYGATFGVKTDIKENPNAYVINMDVPGMEKENINVEVKNNTLLVSGERKSNQEQKNTNYYRQERKRQ